MPVQVPEASGLVVPDPVALDLIALLARQPEVLDGIGAPSGQWEEVVKRSTYLVGELSPAVPTPVPISGDENLNLRLLASCAHRR